MHGTSNFKIVDILSYKTRKVPYTLDGSLHAQSIFIFSNCMRQTDWRPK